MAITMLRLTILNGAWDGFEGDRRSGLKIGFGGRGFAGGG